MRLVAALLGLSLVLGASSVQGFGYDDVKAKKSRDPVEVISKRYGPPVKHFALTHVDVKVTCWKSRSGVDGFYFSLFQGPEGSFTKVENLGIPEDLDKVLTVSYEMLRLSDIVKRASGFDELITKWGQPDSSLPTENGVGHEGSYRFKGVSDHVTLIVDVNASGAMDTAVAPKKHMLPDYLISD